MMRNHSHEPLRQHIPEERLESCIREQWRATRYQEALEAHHKYSSDRPCLITMAKCLISSLHEGLDYFSRPEVFNLLDIGCGTAEVTMQILDQLLPCARKLNYIGMDKDAGVIEIARHRMRDLDQNKVVQAIFQVDFTSQNLADELGLMPQSQHMIWAIHSGYYAAEDLHGFLKRINSLTAPDGVVLMIHNIGGNERLRGPAHDLGMKAYGIRFERVIELPRVPDEMFEALCSDPGDLQSFCDRFAGVPAARELRLMLEFYIVDYPLEALSVSERTLYINNWMQHLKNNDWVFANAHELMVLLPGHRTPGSDITMARVMEQTFEKAKAEGLYVEMVRGDR